MCRWYRLLLWLPLRLGLCYLPRPRPRDAVDVISRPSRHCRGLAPSPRRAAPRSRADNAAGGDGGGEEGDGIRNFTIARNALFSFAFAVAVPSRFA